MTTPVHLPVCSANHSRTRELSAWQRVERTGWSRTAGLLNGRRPVHGLRPSDYLRPNHHSLLVSAIPKTFIPRSRLPRPHFMSLGCGLEVGW